MNFEIFNSYCTISKDPLSLYYPPTGDTYAHEKDAGQEAHEEAKEASKHPNVIDVTSLIGEIEALEGSRPSSRNESYLAGYRLGARIRRTLERRIREFKRSVEKAGRID